MRVTEQDNPITRHFDLASHAKRIKLVAQVEQQLFGSPEWGAGLLGEHFLDQLARLSHQVQNTLKRNGTLVIGGAGTSGRLALQVAAHHGPRLTTGRLVGLLAGGMAAFFKAKEGVEDSPQQGAEDLSAVIKQPGPLLYIGITCGLSAAYVAGQLAEAHKRPDSYVAVIGFNPLEQANSRILDGLGKSLKDLLRELQQSTNGMLLNPILGPEPITGSTRMKGGTASKMILDLLLTGAEPREYLQQSQAYQQQVYKNAPALIPVLEAAATALERGKRIIYLAPARQGLMALLDASEIPPTFGAQPHQVTCLVAPAIQQLLPGFEMEPHRLANLANCYRPGDALLVLGAESTKLELPAAFAAVGISLKLSPEIVAFTTDLPPEWREPYLDLALKTWLNLVTTCAFAANGKISGNRMIDLRISNLKLWDRAVRIIAELAEVTTQYAERQLLAAIPGSREETAAGRVALAARLERLVPTAIIMSRHQLTLKQARTRLESRC